MESLRGTSISQIKAVPGLFISDRFAARSVSLLKSLNIGYVLSVTRPEYLPKFNSGDGAENETSASKDELVVKHIDINDDPTEDILQHLKDACDWIETSLTAEPTKAEVRDPKQVGVLVHCTQGISRSGSIVIAYLMRALKLDYSSALALARESRALITPNSGFEYQLRVWQHCGYDVYVSESAASTTSPLQDKYAYKVWKSNRDALLGIGEEAINKSRFATMAKVAASFGKRRIEAKEEKGKKEMQGGEGSNGEENSQGWENVEKMEQE